MVDKKRLYKKIIRKQILNAREHYKNDLLDREGEREREREREREKIFNFTYCPAFQNVRSTMEKLHILLTPNNNGRCGRCEPCVKKDLLGL